jgi:hypothetical protein
VEALGLVSQSAIGPYVVQMLTACILLILVSNVNSDTDRPIAPPLSISRDQALSIANEDAENGIGRTPRITAMCGVSARLGLRSR